MQKKVRVLNKQQANELAAKAKPNPKNNSDSRRKQDDSDAPPLSDYQLTQFKPFIFLKNKLRL